jgi:hypothetical protein
MTQLVAMALPETCVRRPGGLALMRNDEDGRIQLGEGLATDLEPVIETRRKSPNVPYRGTVV